MNPNQTSPTSSVKSPAQTPTMPPKAKAPEFLPKPEVQLSAPHRHTSWGEAIGIVIIILVLIVGALYFWGASIAKQDAIDIGAVAPADLGN